MSWSGTLDRPVVLVSGKGGTGKSTVAAALATFAARDGRRVLLVEMEGRGEIARALDVPDPGFVERATPLGFSVLSIDASAAAVEYLQLFSGLDRVARRIVTSGALEQVVGGGPGFRDLLICGKLYEIARLRPAGHPRSRGRPRYDLVVVDAPPTGQIAGFLSAPQTFAEMIRVGRMRRQAAGIAVFLRTEARVVVTATPEEMAVAETLEALPLLAAARVAVGPVVANRCLDEVFPKGTRTAFQRVGATDLQRLWGSAGLALESEAALALREAAAAEESRRRVQRRFVRELTNAAPTLELPELPGLLARSLAEALADVMASRPAQTASARHRILPKYRSPTRPAETDLKRHLDGAEVIVTCGSGGVGKTTVSAAIAIRLTPRRGDAALLTIDPARRLATALRLPAVAGDRTALRLGPGRRLDVMQLDTQRTFDEVVERYGGSRERKDRILSNRFYRRIADTLAGTHEYMAMEKLYELAEEEDHEVIVIDTPPTRSALSFLDAPRRLTDFLGGRFLKWMVRPSVRAGRLTLAAARFGTGPFLRAAGRFLGTQTLADTVEFLTAFEGMYGGFVDRADRVLELLRSERCAFVVVTTPSEAGLDEAGYFLERLGEARMRPAAVVVNRWHPALPPLPDHAGEVAAGLERGDVSQRTAAAVLLAAVRMAPQLHAEQAAVASFAARHPDVPILAVPELVGNVHDVSGLRRIGAHLFEEERRNEKMR
jgi:anion-transporting  ArsA/GET3 family ATPase